MLSCVLCLRSYYASKQAQHATVDYCVKVSLSLSITKTTSPQGGQFDVCDRNLANQITT